MRKQLLLFVILNLLIVAIQPISVLATENLSPVVTVEWGDKKENSESVTEETSTEVGKTSQNTSQDSTQEVTTEEVKNNKDSSQKSSQEEVESADNGGPKDFVDILEIMKDDSVQTASDYYLLDIKGEDVKVVLRGYVSQDNIGYLTLQEPPFLPQTYLIETQENMITNAYLPMEQLANYAADAINMYPHVYASSPIEDFYVYVQENHEKIQGKFVQSNPEDDMLVSSYQEFLTINQFLKEVTIEFLETYGSELTMETHDNLSTLILQEDVAQKFTEIFVAKLNEEPAMDHFENWAEQGIEGTMTINQETLEIGLGLLSDQGEGVTKGIEYYIQPVEQAITMPNADQVLDEQGLIDLTGSNVVNDIDAFNQDVNVEDFTEEEQN